MADTKVSMMADSGVPAEDDLLYLVDVSSADPKERRLTIANLAAAVKIDADLNVNNEGGIAFWKLLSAATSGVGTPVELLDKDGNRISLLAFAGSIVSLTFSALFTATNLTNDAAGYKIEGVVKMDGGPGSSVAVGPFFTTTLAEDADWSVVASVDMSTDTLRFHFTGSVGNSCFITGHIHLVYLVGEE